MAVWVATTLSCKCLRRPNSYFLTDMLRAQSALERDKRKQPPFRNPRPTLFQRILPSDVVMAMVQIATNCERTAEETERRFKSSPNVYFRLNVEQGMQNVTLAQWDKLGEVATHTNQYLLKVEVDQKVGAAVRAIQERRGVIATTQLST